MLNTLLSEYASLAGSPRDLFRSIKSALSRILPWGIFFTAAYARLNRQTGKLFLVNAGRLSASLVGTDAADPSLVWQDITLSLSRDDALSIDSTESITGLCPSMSRSVICERFSIHSRGRHE